MCVSEWNVEYPLHIERRDKERLGTMMEGFFTLTYNVLRKHDPQCMQVVENK
jgi:hypothetical protein